MKKERKLIRRYRDILPDYAFDPSPFCADEPRIRAVKEIIATRLSQVDRTIILLYVDCQSFRKLGERMGLSHMTVRREVMRIKELILKELESYDLL